MILIAFASLQILDLLTTTVFLHHGVGEANPLIRAALSSSVSPLLVLIAAKVFGVTVAVVAWYTRRRALLRKINWLFAVLVVWNMVAIALAA
jgi:hypothetical protein